MKSYGKMVTKFLWQKKRKKETGWFSWKGLLLHCSPLCHIPTSGHISLLLFSSQGLCSCSKKEDTTIHARDDNPSSLPPFHPDNCWPCQEQHRKELPLLHIIFLPSVENKAFHLLLCSWVSNLWCQHGCWEMTLKQEEVGSGMHGAGWLCWCDVTHTCLSSTSKDIPSC